MMKKILHISKFYHPYYGGIEDVVFTIVNELRPYYQQRVICFNHESGSVRTIDNGVEILRVNTPITIASQPISCSLLFQLKQEIASFQPDIIHIHLPNPLACMYLNHISMGSAKLVVHWHADILGKKLLYPLCKPIENTILQRATHIITTSQQYIQLSLPLQPYLDKITIIPNTINEQKLTLYAGEEQEIARIQQKYNNRPIILFIGRHVGYKGVDYLINAVPYLDPNAVILIGGTGQQTEHLKRLSQPYQDRIHFIGRLPNQEMKHYLHAATVFAFPSIDRREAFGVALAEALYCGTPAVSFLIQGSGTTWVNQNNKTGIVVEALSSKDYAMAINTIIADNELRQQFSENATRWIQQNFLKNQIQKLRDIYD